ncbi:MAG: hypothetical protein H7296_09190 [Bacteroidia bacterium]|nr:hypothetical protein [Bacteroidia bacterium]
MAAENYYINRDDSKHTLYGILGTILVHGLIIAILFFVVMYPPDPPYETQGKGIQMSLGEENMGGPSATPIPEPAPTENYTPISEQPVEEKEITSETDESVNIKEKNTEKPLKKREIKIKTEIKKQVLELPKKTVNQNALFTKKNAKNNGGHGDGSESGNEGRADGNINGDPNGEGLGNEGTGLGRDGNGNSANGPTIDLAGRRVQKLPDIEDNSRSVGKVVVRIVVNREGRVIKAVPGQVGSTTTESNLLEKAKEGALKTKFYLKDDAPDEQYGTMTFVFRFKP